MFKHALISLLAASSLLSAINHAQAQFLQAERTSVNAPTSAAPVIATIRRLPDLPQTITSFGAAVADGWLYTYGGHTGEAHSYSVEEQEHTLRRLSLNKPGKWENVAEGPHRQGLALVAYKGKLYRVGGFAARNAKGAKHDLHSAADVACFDPQTNRWQALPSLPEARSSHDAAVLGDRLYVIGGWNLNGEKETHWHTTACVMDLSAERPVWESLPAPRFQRRALAAAAHKGKMYVLGGMQQTGGPTTRVDVFDPATGGWSQGPSLPGEPMEGFGCSGFDAGGKLFVSTFKGRLLVLSDDSSKWQTRGTLERARFFHRLLPVADSELVLLGGANMETGKFAEVDVINAR